MVSITLQNIKANTALDLVAELKSAGLVLNTDFEWSYHHERVLYDLGGSEIIPRCCEFKFLNPTLATFYTLKWQKHYT